MATRIAPGHTVTTRATMMANKSVAQCTCGDRSMATHIRAALDNWTDQHRTRVLSLEWKERK